MLLQLVLCFAKSQYDQSGFSNHLTILYSSSLMLKGVWGFSSVNKKLLIPSKAAKVFLENTFSLFECILDNTLQGDVDM